MGSNGQHGKILPFRVTFNGVTRYSKEGLPSQAPPVGHGKVEHRHRVGGRESPIVRTKLFVVVVPARAHKVRVRGRRHRREEDDHHAKSSYGFRL